MANAASFDLSASGAGRLAVRGELGFDTAAALLKRSDGAFADGQGPLQIDLAGVTQADSAGLALLLEWRARAARAGRQIQFLNLPPQILAVARISEVEELLTGSTGPAAQGSV